MASNSKYNIDCGNIRPRGQRTKGLYAHSKESLWAQLGGTKIYDKVLYELAMNDVSGADPAGETFIAANYATQNQKTHGNGVVESNLLLNASEFTFRANTSTANTVSTSVTVTQWDSDLGDYVGASVTWNLVQDKDYPVSISLSLSEAPDIPASGGTVSSVPYTATTTFRSGNVSYNYGTISWGSPVSAGDLGITVKPRTFIGNLTATITYTCNGKTVSATASTSVYQEANAIERGLTYYTNFNVYGINYSDFEAEGGTQPPSSDAYATQTQHDVYTSGKENPFTIYPDCYWEIYAEDNWLSFSNAYSPSTNATADEWDGDEYRYTRVYTTATAKTDNSRGSDWHSVYQNAVPRRLESIVLSLLSAPNISSKGGTVTINDVTKTVTAHFDDNSTSDVTSQSTYSASSDNGTTAVTASATDEPGYVGTIKVYAKYSGLTSNDDSIDIQKVDRSEVSREVTALTVNPIEVSGPVSYIAQTVTASQYASVDLTYKVYYDNDTTEDVVVRNYTGSGITYYITTDVNWCDPNDSSSRSTSFKVDKNTGEDERTCTITTNATYDVNTSINGSADSTFKQSSRVFIDYITFTISSCPDIPVTGGTVTYSDCTYKVIATYKDGSSADITNECSFDWTIPSCTTDETNPSETNRRKIGEIGGTAKYFDEDGNTYDDDAEIDVYQKPNTTTYGTIEFYSGVDKIIAPASGTSYDFRTYDFDKPFKARRKVYYASGDEDWEDVTNIWFVDTTYTVNSLGIKETSSETYITTIKVYALKDDDTVETSFDIYQEINRIEEVIKDRLEIYPCDYEHIFAIGGEINPINQTLTYVYETYIYTSTDSKQDTREVSHDFDNYEWTVSSNNLAFTPDGDFRYYGPVIDVDENTSTDGRCAEITFTVRTITNNPELTASETITLCQDGVGLEIDSLKFTDVKDVYVGAGGRTGITKPDSYKVIAHWNNGSEEDVTDSATIVNVDKASYDVASLEDIMQYGEKTVYKDIESYATYNNLTSNHEKWDIIQYENVLTDCECTKIEVVQEFTHSTFEADANGTFDPDKRLEAHVEGYYTYSSGKRVDINEKGYDNSISDFWFDVSEKNGADWLNVKYDGSPYSKIYGYKIDINANTSTSSRSTVLQTTVRYSMPCGGWTEWSNPVESTITQEGVSRAVTKVYIEGNDVTVHASGDTVTYPSNYKVYADFNTGEQRVDVTDSATYYNDLPQDYYHTYGSFTVQSLETTIQEGTVLVKEGIKSWAEYGGVKSDELTWNIYQSKNIIESSGYTIEVTQPFEHSETFDATTQPFPMWTYQSDKTMQGHVSWYANYTSGAKDGEDVTGGESNKFEFDISSDATWVLFSAYLYDENGKKESWYIFNVENNTSTSPRSATVKTRVRYWLPDGSKTDWSAVKETTINQKGAELKKTPRIISIEWTLS